MAVAVVVENPTQLSRERVLSAIRHASAKRYDDLRIRRQGTVGDADPSEVDREERALNNRRNGEQSRQLSTEMRQIEAFLEILCSTQPADPLEPGGIIVLQTDGQKTIWYMYDPKSETGECRYAGFGVEEALAGELGVDEFVFLPVNCPLYEAMLMGKTLRVGIRIACRIDGNPDYRAEVIGLV